MTSADSLRLWLVAKSADDRAPADCPDPLAIAARIEPTVTLPFDEHIEAVYRYAKRLTGRFDLAEEVAQETLLRGWRNRRQLRESRAARLWLFQIATHVWADYLRKSKVQPHRIEIEPPCPRRRPSELSDEREHVQLALSAMDQLPSRQRQVIYLVTCEELSHQEVADVLGISLATVKSNLSLARKEMRRRLKDVYESVCARPVGGKCNHDA